MRTPEQGDVWAYDYLWSREALDGETEGRKTRPTAMVATAVGRDGRTFLYILPITTQRPAEDRLALEVPEIERKRSGLDADRRLWVMLDEYNFDIAEASYYLSPTAKIGSFSARFHHRALSLFIKAIRDRRTVKVPRTD